MKAIKDIRLPNYDYSSMGYYFVTVSSDGSERFLEQYQAAIIRALESLSKDNAILDFYVIMPDHLHMIIALENSGLTLGEVIRRFKSRASREAGIKLWQPNYYEHVIRTEKALNKIREYIRDNPEALEIKLEEMYK